MSVELYKPFYIVCYQSFSFLFLDVSNSFLVVLALTIFSLHFLNVSKLQNVGDHDTVLVFIFNIQIGFGKKVEWFPMNFCTVLNLEQAFT